MVRQNRKRHQKQVQVQSLKGTGDRPVSAGHGLGCPVRFFNGLFWGFWLAALTAVKWTPFLTRGRSCFARLMSLMD